MDENPDLIKRIKEIADEVIPLSVREEVFTVHKINREGRVILAGKNNRGIKPSSCYIYEVGR
jgi:hypothetical protein